MLASNHDCKRREEEIPDKVGHKEVLHTLSKIVEHIHLPSASKNTHGRILYFIPTFNLI